jgi:hypothetical protein
MVAPMQVKLPTLETWWFMPSCNRGSCFTEASPQKAG